MSSSFYFKERFSLIQFIFFFNYVRRSGSLPFSPNCLCFLSMLLFVLFYYKMKQSAHPFSLKKKRQLIAAKQIAKKIEKIAAYNYLINRIENGSHSDYLKQKAQKTQPLIFFCHIQHSVHSFQKAQTQEVCTKYQQTSCGFFFNAMQPKSEPIKPIILTSSTPASKAGGFNQPNTLHC